MFKFIKLYWSILKESFIRFTKHSDIQPTRVTHEEYKRAEELYNKLQHNPIIKVYDKTKKHYIVPWEGPGYNDIDVLYADGKWYWAGGSRIDKNRYRIEVYYE